MRDSVLQPSAARFVRFFRLAAAVFVAAIAVLAGLSSRADAQAAYDFCPAGAGAIFNVVNGVQIWRLDPPGGTATRVTALDQSIPTNLNGLMVDPIRNRLLFVSRPTASTTQLWAYDPANPTINDWYDVVGASFASPDFPRAAMSPSGIGYLIGGGASPEVWRVTASGSFNYTVQRIPGNLTYDIAPTDTGSGDIAFDGNGIAWLSVGQDLYTVDLAGGSLTAVRQTRPLLNGSPSAINWAGIAFGADGRLYVAQNNASNTYYAYDPGTGNLTLAGTAAGGARDLASCAFPVLAQPKLSVAKTLALVDGAAYVAGSPINAGDVLTYRITVTNTGGAVGTLFPGDVDEIVPANTAFVSAGSNFTCTGSTCTNPGPTTYNLPANGGTATLNFVVRVNDPLASSVSTIDNAVTVADVDCVAPGNDCVESTPVGMSVSVAKSSNPASGTTVSPGDTITYTLTAAVAGSATSEPLSLTDALGTGLTPGTITSQDPQFGGSCAVSGQVLTCALPTGAPVGSYSVTYTAMVDAGATGNVANAVTATNPPGGDPDPVCTTCTTSHPITAAPVISTVKTSDPATGSTVAPGETLTYTVTTTVATASTTAVFQLTDTAGAGLTLGTVTSDPQFGSSCTASGQALSCSLPAGTPVGSYAVSYTATVNPDATGTVGNQVTTAGGGDPDPECAACTTSHPVELPVISTAKIADPVSGTSVAPGQTITYTVTTTVATASTTAVFQLTDAIGTGLTLGSVTSQAPQFGSSCTPSGQTLTCLLPAGTPVGSYAVSYTATVNPDATGTVGNQVTTAGGGDPDPECAACTTSHPIVDAAIAVAKSSNPASGTAVNSGNTIAYTVTVTVADSATTEPVTLTDVLSSGLTFGAVTDAGPFICSGSLSCELPAGTLPGSYALTYTATVDTGATGEVANAVTASTPPGGGSDPVCTACTTKHLIAPVISTVKSSDPASGTEVQSGQSITYTVTTTVVASSTTADFQLTDTAGAGLTLGAVTSDPQFGSSCTPSGQALSCSLPAGTPVGSYAVSYTATVNPDATGTVGNQVTTAGGGDPDPECAACTTSHPVIAPAITLVKKLIDESGSTDAVAEPGEILSYEITLTNQGGATTSYALQDVLDSRMNFASANNGGLHTGGNPGGGTVNWSGLSVPAGTSSDPGALVLRVSVTVADPLPDNAAPLQNIVKVPSDPQPECPSDQCVVTPAPEPKILLEKTGKFKDVDGNGAADPGDTIVYSFTVTNDGNVPLTEVVPEDAGPTFSNQKGTGELSAFDPNPATNPVTLAPKGAQVFTATYVLTQVDIDNGAGIVKGVENRATATGHAFGDAVTSIEVESDESVSILALPAAARDISIAKIAGLRSIRRGEQAPFTIRVTNNSGSRVSGLTVVDTMPSGFRYVDGSAAIAGVAAMPVVEGRSIRFEDIVVEAHSDVNITLRMLALSSAGPGEHTNRANVTDPSGRPLAPEATATVEILIEPVFDCGDIIGKVFDDIDRNGYQDEGEPGLPGVRIATAKGWLVTTDKYGRFHVPCAALPDQRIGSNFIMKLDTRTLPTGYRLATENPRVVRLTAGKMTKLNFGASIGRVVRLDLKDEAFEAGSVELTKRWAEGIDQLIEVLGREQSVLRLAYVDATTETELAEERLKRMSELIEARWRDEDGRYRLEIETRVEAAE
ncbi:isopeptide-forming domain-containing fimbrial protein [Mesorhizobium caraganae]|uniref:DUF7927 domain-containing protein n=1 Tax=Mesorhizobium caraganae TaxID=483206 RepID=UPI00193A66CE|nr:isopeptide-forming domain-containing fimbrial protein [Mesorhizobium caraganae]MBM2709968.1 isopeptide-forming domain-containing fimbrial protein [Mesorhizobium caraganae]